MGTKHSKEEVQRVIDLHNQGLGNRLIHRETGIDRERIKWWISQYKKHGDSFLDGTSRPVVYDYALREAVVREVLENHLSLRQAAINYGLNKEVVRKWVGRVRTSGYESLMERHKKTDKASLLEVDRLKIELERAKTEIALLKKVKALMEERDPSCREPGQKPSNH